MPSIHKRAMNYFDRLNLRELKNQCRKLVARAAFPSRSRRSISRSIIIVCISSSERSPGFTLRSEKQTKPNWTQSDPTDFQKDPDPFSSMIALPANRYANLAPHHAPCHASCTDRNMKEQLIQTMKPLREYVEREGILAPTFSSKSQDLPTRSTPEQRSASSRSARTQAENSRTHLAQQAVSTSEEQTPTDLADSDFFPLESAREVKADMA